MFEVFFQKLRIPLFEKLLDASANRQRAIATNIANIATPGYKAKDVDFQQVLTDTSEKVLRGRRTSERHLPIGEDNLSANTTIVHSSTNELMSGENNVDIDREMAKAAENQLLYSATAKIVNNKFSALHKCITGRV